MTTLDSLEIRRRAAAYGPGARWRFDGIQSVEPIAGTGMALPHPGKCLLFRVEHSPSFHMAGLADLHPRVRDGNPAVPGIAGEPPINISKMLNVSRSSASDVLRTAVLSEVTIYAPTFTDERSMLHVLDKYRMELLPFLEATVDGCEKLEKSEREALATAVEQFRSTGWSGYRPPVLEKITISVLADNPQPHIADSLTDSFVASINADADRIESLRREKSSVGADGQDTEPFWRIYEPLQYAEVHQLKVLSLEENEVPVLEIAALVGSAERVEGPVPELLQIASSGPYVGLQQILARPDLFEDIDGVKFPQANMKKGGVRSSYELRPHSPEDDDFLSADVLAEIGRGMWEQTEQLSDRDADTLDGLMSTWIQKARGADEKVPVFIDDLLKQRGLKRKKSGTGRRGGFEEEQRRALWKCLLRLQNVWVHITLPDRKFVRSRAVVLTDTVGQMAFDGTVDIRVILVTPGAVFGKFLFGPGRQAALLATQALRYDPARHPFEKRLTRLLAWHWRVGASRGDFLRTYIVRTILEEVGFDTRPRHPARVRSRFEESLDRLQRDQVIANWQYQDGWREEALPRQGWFSTWCEARIVIEAPDAIKHAYRNLDQGLRRKSLRRSDNWKECLRHRRRLLEYSQMKAAEEIGVSRASVARIERGERPSKSTVRKLRRWLKSTEPAD